MSPRVGPVALLLACLVVALSTAPAASAEVRAAQVSDPAGDGEPGRDIIGADVAFDSSTGGLSAVVRFAGPIEGNGDLNVTASFGSIGPGGTCGTGTSRAGLTTYVGVDPTVFVTGNPALTANAVTNSVNEIRQTDGRRTIAADRTSVALTGTLAQVAGAELRCMTEVYLFLRGAAIVPDKIASFPLAAVPVALPPPPAVTPPAVAPSPVAPPDDVTGPAFTLPDGGRRIAASGQRIRVRIGRLSESASGTVVLRTATRVRLTRRSPARVLTLGRGAFDTGGDASASVPVRLSAAARRLLRARGQLRVRATVLVIDDAGNQTTRRVTFTAAAPR